mgnify:FL=1
MRDPQDIVFEIARHYVADNEALLGERVAKRILGWIRSRNIPALSTSRSDEMTTALQSSNHWRILAQVEALFKKNSAFSDPTSGAKQAIRSFDKAETLCRITNRRLDYYYTHLDRLDPDMRKQCQRAERFVENVLGESRSFLDTIPGNLRLTGGATNRRSRREAVPFMKIGNKIACSVGAVPFVETFYQFVGMPLKKVIVTSWNRVVVVPKNWKTGRTIAAEPEGDLPFQLCFDSYVKRRLLRIGIDLSDQFRNQVLALWGSLTGRFATVDFSMASDTAAYNAVAWLFPQKWFEIMQRLRCTHGILQADENLCLERREWKYAKFSSMGNGMTFTIETLMFAAFAYAVGSKTISVYGDDVIVDTEVYEDYCRLAKFFGFVVNQEKSYDKGPFRESCGGDFFLGDNVTPFYLREKFGERKADDSHMVNGLASIADPGGKLEQFLVQFTRERKLPLVPYCPDSTVGVWVAPHLLYDQKILVNRPKKGVSFRGFIAKPRRIHHCKDYRGYFLWMLGVKNRESRSSSANRHSSVRWKIGRALFCELEDTVKMDIDDYQSSVWTRSDEITYRRKWISYRPQPVRKVPDYIYWWTEAIQTIQC